MIIIELGAIGEFVGSIVVTVMLVYLAVQVRQNTAQQMREETVSITRGQNQVIAQLTDPPTPINTLWSIFTTEAWESSASDL